MTIPVIRFNWAGMSTGRVGINSPSPWSAADEQLNAPTQPIQDRRSKGARSVCARCRRGSSLNGTVFAYEHRRQTRAHSRRQWWTTYEDFTAADPPRLPFCAQTS